MTILLFVLLPFVGIFLPLLLERFGRLAATLAAGVPTLGAFALLMSLAPSVLAGEVLVVSKPWVPALGLTVGLRVDGLGFLFALMILGIGLLVIQYAYYYLYEKDPIGRFFSYLMLFMGAMLGVVLSENVLLMGLFWEITSLSSFLLIGYWSEKAAARRGARMALTITGLGGLSLFAGLVILGQIVGSYELTEILASGELIVGHDWYLPMLCLVLLGAFTKSAQFPFHFWLPNAMTAPTPVSAYLHSATMVKAGVFLLARLHPALSGGDAWVYLVGGVGIATMVFAAYVAFFRHDLKGLLAYSTISHLGLITALFGFGTATAAVVGVFHIMNHAAFKASLFMTAGIIDHETGTRDIRILGNLRKVMPYTMVLALLGSAAMAGIPFFNGFLSKELFLKETLTAPMMTGVPWLIPVIVTAGAVFSMAYSVRLVHGVFFEPGQGETPKKGQDPSLGMLFPVAVLVAICVVVGIAPEWTAAPILAAAAQSVVGGELPSYTLSLWHGFTMELLMSAIAIVGGLLVYTQRNTLYAFAERVWPALTGKMAFEKIIALVVDAAARLTALLENGSLQRYLALLLMMALAAGALPFIQYGFVSGPQELTATNPVAIAVWGLLVASALATVLTHHKRITAIIFLSVVGLLISIVFVYMSAPDLALTQLSVEVVTILLLLLALFVLPKASPVEGSRLRKGRDIALAALGGLGMGAISWAVMTRPQESISDFYLENATYPVGGGTNVVNVILVDFRGFDTLGEVAVLVLAAFGIFTMLRYAQHTYVEGVPDTADDRYPVVLVSASRPLLALVLLMALFIFLRGHYLPGGGFIGGLVASVALIMQYLASGVDWANERMRMKFRYVAVAGLLIATLAGCVAFVMDLPFLTMTLLEMDVPLLGESDFVMTLLFDLGIFLAVVGSTMTILSQLSHMHGEAVPYDEAERAKESNPWKP